MHAIEEKTSLRPVITFIGLQLVFVNDRMNTDEKAVLPILYFLQKSCNFFRADKRQCSRADHPMECQEQSVGEPLISQAVAVCVCVCVCLRSSEVEAGLPGQNSSSQGTVDDCAGLNGQNKIYIIAVRVKMEN